MTFDEAFDELVREVEHLGKRPSAADWTRAYRRMLRLHRKQRRAGRFLNLEALVAIRPRSSPD